MEVEEVGAVKEVSIPVAQVATPSPAPTSAPSPAPKAAEPKVEKKEVVVSPGQEVIEAPMPGNIWKIGSKRRRFSKSRRRFINFRSNEDGKRNSSTKGRSCG